MAGNKTNNLLSRLDDTEKYGIITDEELEEIGALYGSREKYEETMRHLASRLSGTQARRHASVTVGMGRTQAGINQGTSTVPLGDLSGIKNINIAGEVISTAGDAALLLSSFRDPRIEIFNIVYTSKTGEILAHTAWTNGLPGFVSTIDKPSPGESLGRILKIKENLNAEKIWIAHNHPSGDPAPSDQDIGATRLYASHFGHSFAGHIVLDHDKYAFIFPDGMSHEYELEKPAINFISTIREQAETIKSPARFASIFKEILSGNEDITVYAILDNAHKIVSWTYGDSDNTAELKNYMRISGGAVAVALTNDETSFRNIFADAYNALDTINDIFLDVIKVDRSTGIAEKCLAQKVGTGGEWQLHESKQVKYIINNQSINVELKLDNISNDNPSVYEDQEKFYVKNDIVNQISNKEQIMTKDWKEKSDKERKQLIDEWIKGRPNDHRYPVNLGNDRYKIRFSDNSEGIFSQEQIDGFYKIYRANQHEAAMPKQREELTAEEIQAKSEFFNPYDFEDNALEQERAFNERAIEIARRERSKNLPKQSESPPLERRNINSKENFMSEQQNTGERTFRPPIDAAGEVAKNEALINMKHQRKIVIDGLSNGTLSCLPGEDGFADTQPAINLVTGKYYHGANLLDLKDHQKKNGFPTAEYVTEHQIEKAKENYPGLSIKQGEKGLSIHWEDKNDQTGEWEKKSVFLFNVAQTTNPEEMKMYAEQKQQEERQNYIDYKRKSYPGWEPQEPKQKVPGPVVECSSTEPDKYLGQYFAAVSMGGKFKASPEQSAEFSQKMKSALDVKFKKLNAEGEYEEQDYPDIRNLSKISNAANAYCKDVIQLSRQQENKEQYKQQQEQTQSRGRGL